MSRSPLPGTVAGTAQCPLELPEFDPVVFPLCSLYPLGGVPLLGSFLLVSLSSEAVEIEFIYELTIPITLYFFYFWRIQEGKF